MSAKLHDILLPKLAAEWGRLQLLELEDWVSSAEGEAQVEKCLYLVDSKAEGGKVLLRRRRMQFSV